MSIMKLELTIEKNVVLKRDKPWSHFYPLNDQDLLCINEQNKFEIVNSTNGKIEHLGQKTITTISKTSRTYCLSNNGQICAFLSSNYEIILWNKDKLIRTIPSCSLANQTIKTISQIFISNNGEQVLLILHQPCRIFLWLKTLNPQIISSTHFRHKRPVCSSISNQTIEEIGTWHEITLSKEQYDLINFERHSISIDVFFRSKNSSIICAFVYIDHTGYIQINRLDIDWKSTIYIDQMISYSFEIIQIPITVSSSISCSIRFAHLSPILAISFLTNLIFVSLTTITFSKLLPIDCTISSSNTQQVSIMDLIWSFDDQLLIGLTNRGALFCCHRFSLQLNLQTQGECITQGPALFVIIHPLIGQDSEATTHLGLDLFMRSIVPFSTDDKTKQQKFSLISHPTKSIFFCSDGYRLARITYSNKIRDRRFYDPLLYLYLIDLNKQEQEQYHIFTRQNRSFDDLPKLIERFDLESLGGGGELNISTKYESLTSLPIDELPRITLDEILTAYTLLLTSSDRVQHEICSCLERTTRSLLLSSEKNDILTHTQLAHCLTNLVLSSTYGSLTFLHLSCLTKFLPLFIQIFKQQTTIVNDPEILELCILYIVEHWLQAILYLPTKLNTFELCRRQKNVFTEKNQDFQLCKAIKQLQLLQGSNVNLEEFLPSSLPVQQENLQGNEFQYNRLTLLRLWYALWSNIEKKLHRDAKNLPKYFNTIRLYLQSVLHSYPSLSAIRFLPYGHQTDLNDLFPPTINHINHPLHTKSYSTLNERRKQRRRSRTSIDQTSSSTPYRRGKPASEARKALVLHRILYSLLEQYHIRDAICILNVALKRETTSVSSCLPLDLFSSNLFQHIDTRTYFGMPGHALRSVLRTLARFMARTMMINQKIDENEEEQLFIYSVDSACPLPNLFQTKQKTKSRIIYLNRSRLNLAIEQENLSQFWQPLKVLELFILGQSPNEAVLFAKLIGDWRTALCLASVLPPHNGSFDSHRILPSYSPLNIITVDALLYTKLCEYLQIDNLKSILNRSYKQDEIIVFLQNLSSTLEQFLLCSTLLQVPLTEMLLRRLNAIMIYLFTLIPIFLSSKYYLPCPPIYTSILNTYDQEKDDMTCKYETHIRLIYYRTIQIFIQILSASRIQLSCLKWYLDYLTMNNNRRRQTTIDNPNDSFQSIKILLKSLRFHKLPNIPDRILIYFRDFCIILFLLDIRDRLSLTLRNYYRAKTEFSTTNSDRLSWQIISYATILLSFRCLISDEINLLRVVLNLFFELSPSEQLMRALATLILARQDDNHDQEINAEVKFMVEKLKIKWSQINPAYVQLYEDFLRTIFIQDVQGDIIEHYMNETIDNARQEPLFDFKPKWFETCVEYGEFMTMLIPLLLDASSITNRQQQELNNDHTKFDSKSIPLLQTMSVQFREFELPMNLDKRYLLKQIPTYIPPHEYVVFPVRMVQYDNQPTMFQQTPTNVNHTTVGHFVQIRSTQQPPGVVSLEQSHRRNYQNTVENEKNNQQGNSGTEWDGRSDDPSRSHVRQFDEPYADAARRSIWMTGWANRGFVSTTDQNLTSSMRIPVSAQFLAASSLISDQQRYETIVKQYQQQHKSSHDQLDNDTDLTNVTKESEDEDGNATQSDLPSSPRRRDLSFRKNSLEESISLPIMSNDAGGEYGRSLDFRAPSRETGGDETPTYDPREFPVDYYKETSSPQHTYQQRISPPTQLSPPTSNGFQQQLQPTRQSLSDRRFLDDSDPYVSLRLEQEERDKFTVPDTTRTRSSKQSPVGHYPSSRDPYDRRSPTRDPHSHRSPTRDSHGHRSPTRDPHSHRSPTRDHHSHRSPTRDSHGHRSPTRESRSRRSPTRDRRRHHNQQQPYFPQIQGPPSSYNQFQVPAPAQYVPTTHLPLLRLGGPVFPTTTILTQPRFLPPTSVPVYPSVPIYTAAAAAPRPPLPMFHMATQLPPPAALSPQATRMDQQKVSYVQNMMHHYAESNRPRLQLLHMRPHPRTNTTNELQIPMPAPNVITTSSDSKIETGVQVEVPRQDGFVLEPGLFQTLLRDATGVNFTSAEAHYSAARQIQQQALEARRRERSTMTDLPAHQILYDLQYARGGEGDERKYVNVTDIAGPHADALLAQIERDQHEREQLRSRQQQQRQPATTNTNEIPSNGHLIGFDRQHAQILQEQSRTMPQPSYPLGFNQPYTQVSEQIPTYTDADELQRRSELILQRRRQREQEEKQAEQTAFGNLDTNRSQRRVSYEPYVQTYEPDEKDMPYDYLIKQRRSTEPLSDASSRIVDPISVRSITPRSPRKQISSDRPISIKSTTPRDPFSPRKIVSHTHSPTASAPRKASSPTIADRHREARQRQQQTLIRVREDEALRLADEALHGEAIPPSRALDEFQLEAVETSFTSTVRELAGANGLINRTYDLDLLDDHDDSLGHGYSDYLSSRPMSATTSNYNQNATKLSSRSTPSRRPSSASSTRSSRQMTPMGKAIVQAKQKGPPPARSNMARKRPLSSPGSLGQKRGSMTTPAKSTQSQTRLVRNIRKASPPAHKPTTYNERVRALSKTDSEVSTTKKSDPSDPKSLMRLYGTRRVPGLYVPYEKTEPRMTKTYSERMQELQRPASVQPRRQRQTTTQDDNELEQRPSSAPSSSISLSDWEVDDRIKQLLADDPDPTATRKLNQTVTPLENLEELDDEDIGDLDATTYSLTRVTEQTNENTYGDDLRLLQHRRTNGLSAHTYGGTRASARSSAGGDMTARDESELSRGESSIGSYLDWSAIDKEFPIGTQ